MSRVGNMPENQVIDYAPAELKSDALRREVFALANETWDENLGDLSMAHVHAIMDALYEAVGGSDDQ